MKEPDPRFAAGAPCPTCAEPLRFDPTLVGQTCGGLELEGWMVCSSGHAWLAHEAREAEGEWRLVGEGRSVDTGRFRIRAEKSLKHDPTELFRRVVRLPELERALRRIAAGADDPVRIAAEALS